MCTFSQFRELAGTLGIDLPLRRFLTVLKVLGHNECITRGLALISHP